MTPPNPYCLIILPSGSEFGSSDLTEPLYTSCAIVSSREDRFSWARKGRSRVHTSPCQLQSFLSEFRQLPGRVDVILYRPRSYRLGHSPLNLCQQCPEEALGQKGRLGPFTGHSFNSQCNLLNTKEAGRRCKGKRAQTRPKFGIPLERCGVDSVDDLACGTLPNKWSGEKCRS